MIYAFYILHVVICLFLILVVLLQQGKGADLSVFGGGTTMTAFGARGAATLLHKLTVWGFVAFIITTMAIGILQGQAENSTVMSGIEAELPAGDGEAAATPADEAEESEAPAALPEAEPAEGDAATDDAADTGAADDAATDAAPADDAAADSAGDDTSQQ